MDGVCAEADVEEAVEPFKSALERRENLGSVFLKDQGVIEATRLFQASPDFCMVAYRFKLSALPS